MKSKLLLVVAVLFGAGMLISAVLPKKTKVVAAKQFTVYWMAKSGEEYLKVGKADYPESAMKMDKAGKIMGADMDIAKERVHFAEQRSFQGKAVEKNFLVITDDMQAESSQTMELKSNSTRETAGKSLVIDCWNKLAVAIDLCYAGFSSCTSSLSLYRSCNYSDYCICVDRITGKSYIVSCSGK